MATRLIFSAEQINVLSALAAGAEGRGKAAEGAYADFYKQASIKLTNP